MPIKPKPYRPSNSTEGDFFEANNCQDCIRYSGGHCDKIARAMIGGQPYSWIYGEDGIPTCTARTTERKKANSKHPIEQQAMVI